MPNVERSPTLSKLADESPKDCTLCGAERSWFCGAERYEEAIISLEAQLAGAVTAIERAYAHLSRASDLGPDTSPMAVESARSVLADAIHPGGR